MECCIIRKVSNNAITMFKGLLEQQIIAVVLLLVPRQESAYLPQKCKMKCNFGDFFYLEQQAVRYNEKPTYRRLTEVLVNGVTW